MSNIALFQDGSALPAFLTSGTSNLTKQLAGSGNSRAISIKGMVFRLVVDGEEVAKKDERHMNVIIVAAQPDVGRAFYAEKFKEGVDAAPTCWSADGKTPSTISPKAQNKTCVGCPQDIKGSGDGESKSCRYNQRIAVLLENDPQGEVYRVTLPAKSLFGKPVNGKMPLQSYSKFLKGHNAPIDGIVTKMAFDTDSAVPVLHFSGVRALTTQEFTLAQAKGQSEEALAAIEVSYPKPKGTTDAPGAALFAEDVATGSAAAAVAPQPDEPKVRAKAVKAEVPASSAQSVSDILGQWADDDND